MRPLVHLSESNNHQDFRFTLGKAKISIKIQRNFMTFCRKFRNFLHAKFLYSGNPSQSYSNHVHLNFDAWKYSKYCTMYLLSDLTIKQMPIRNFESTSLIEN